MQDNSIVLSHSTILNKTRKLIFSYLEQLDSIEPSMLNIFKKESGKIDLETKVWHHFHKLEAAEYHYQQVVIITTTVRERMKIINTLELEKSMTGSGEFRYTIQDQKILFEVEAFFAAVQSAVDFLACVLSRYIKGKDTDEFDNLQKFLKNSIHPISQIINQAWLEWVLDLANYRDYLIHKGVLPIPKATSVKVMNSFASDPVFNGLKQEMQDEQNLVVFPLPKKPDPEIRLTRREILDIDKPELSSGIIETTTKITFSTSNKNTGPRTSISLGRNIGSFLVNAKSDVSLGGESKQIKFTQLKLASGYVEAETLCEEIFEKLTNLSTNIFLELIKIGFVHIV